jgi:hypothetical protein
MAAFDYLSVMVSIVLGLGVAQLLTTLGVIIRERDHIKPYWLTVLWIGILVLIHVQTWWAMFGMRDHEGWSFPGFFMLLLQPILLYLLSSLLTPNLDAGTDMVGAFARQSRAFFGIFILILLVSVAKELVVGGRLPGPANLAAHGVFLAVATIGVLTRRRQVQEIMGPIIGLLMLAYIGVLFMRLEPG